MGIGVSRKQRVFAVVESTVGTIVFPATADFIRPAGDAVLNQNPGFTDSEEKQDTLDVLDRFRNAVPPGEFTLPMYLRTVANYATPQGDILFQSWQGGVNPTTAGSLASGVLDTHSQTGATISLITGGTFPEVGVIQVGTEEIYYGAMATTASSDKVRITDCTRGYRSTTTASHASGDTVDLLSRWYPQDTDSPSFSLWVESDHFTQGLAGCSVNNAVLGVDNEGAVNLTFTGQGTEMVWAGRTQLAAHALASTGGGATWATVDNASLFSVGAYIWNETAPDSNSGAGHIITAVNATDNTIKFTASTTNTSWATDDYICGYLPEDVTVLGTVVESRNTDIELDGVSATIKNTDFTFDVPKEYITDEVGTTYPSDYIENQRSIMADLDLYFREANAAYFKEGFEGNDVSFWARFGGNAGRRLELWMPRCKLEVPTINFTAPAINLTIPLKALGTDGEDSCQIILT